MKASMQENIAIPTGIKSTCDIGNIIKGNLEQGIKKQRKKVYGSVLTFELKKLYLFKKDVIFKPKVETFL